MLLTVRLAGHWLSAAEVEVGVAGIADRPQAAVGTSALLHPGALAAQTRSPAGGLAGGAAARVE